LRNQEKLVAPKDLDLIFLNTEQLLAINSELLKDLERNRGDPNAEVQSARGIAEAFVRLGPYLKSYTVYCAQQQNAVAHVLALSAKNERLSEVLNHYKSTPDARKLDLPSYLIKPVQRICKYPLLLRELIRATPEGHPDNEILQKAEGMVQAVASAINEGKRSAEASDWLFDLQNRIEGAAQIGLMAPARKFIRSGPIKQITTDRKVLENYYFLFNDIFLVVEHTKKEEQYLLVSHFPFGSTLVNAEPGTMPSPNAFEIIHMAHSKMILYMDSEREKDEIFNELASLIRGAKGEVIDAPAARPPDWRKSVVGKAVPKPPNRSSPGPSPSPTLDRATPSPPTASRPPPPASAYSKSAFPTTSSRPASAHTGQVSSVGRSEPPRPASEIISKPSAVSKPTPAPIKTTPTPTAKPSPPASPRFGTVGPEACSSCKTAYTKPQQRFCTSCGLPRAGGAAPTTTTTTPTATRTSSSSPSSSGYAASGRLASRTVYKYQSSGDI
ncbi:MAG: hypothetical protein Q8P67_28645, partial [archaeon]|nr:hypothetical protein [archaeon]